MKKGEAASQAASFVNLGTTWKQAYLTNFEPSS
jgi:hypothetical protein